MAEYRWANVYKKGHPAWWDTRELADKHAHSDRIRCDRYRIEDNGILVYDPEPTPEPPVDFEAWLIGDEHDPENRGLCRLREKPSGGWKHATHVRVRDKAADDKLLETMRLRLAGLEDQRQRAIEAEAKLATLTRERDEALEQRNEARSFHRQVCQELTDLEQQVAEATKQREAHGYTVVKLAAEKDARIAEFLERQVAEAKKRAMQEQLADLRAENAELRRVLGQCEWGCPCGEKGGACPLCDAAFLRPGPRTTTKHKPDCPLGRALGRPECGEGA